MEEIKINIEDIKLIKSIESLNYKICISCSLFTMKKSYRNFKKYLEAFENWYPYIPKNAYVRMYIDSSLEGLDEKSSKKLLEIMKYPKLEIYKVDCDAFKIKSIFGKIERVSKYHEGTFMSMARFLSLYEKPKLPESVEYIWITDIDMPAYNFGPDNLEILNGNLGGCRSDILYNSKSYYPVSWIDESFTPYPIINEKFIVRRKGAAFVKGDKELNIFTLNKEGCGAGGFSSFTSRGESVRGGAGGESVRGGAGGESVRGGSMSVSSLRTKDVRGGAGEISSIFDYRNFIKFLRDVRNGIIYKDIRNKTIKIAFEKEKYMIQKNNSDPKKRKMELPNPKDFETSFPYGFDELFTNKILIQEIMNYKHSIVYGIDLKTVLQAFNRISDVECEKCIKLYEKLNESEYQYYNKKDIASFKKYQKLTCDTYNSLIVYQDILSEDILKALKIYYKINGYSENYPSFTGIRVILCMS